MLRTIKKAGKMPYYDLRNPDTNPNKTLRPGMKYRRLAGGLSWPRKMQEGAGLVLAETSPSRQPSKC